MLLSKVAGALLLVSRRCSRPKPLVEIIRNAHTNVIEANRSWGEL